MDGERGRREGGSERRREGTTERGRVAMTERGKKGDRKGGLQLSYHEKDTDQYIQYIAHITRHKAALNLVPNCEPERSRVTI